MTVITENLGPGTLTLGTGPLAVSGQITNCRVEAAEQVSSTDPVPVLSGEETDGTDRVTFNWTLAGALFQDWSAAGVVDWSWTNKGTPQPFVFIPSTAAARSCTGTTYPVPITFGGDVTGTATRPGEPATADFSWRCKNGDDEPVIADVP